MNRCVKMMTVVIVLGMLVCVVLGWQFVAPEHKFDYSAYTYRQIEIEHGDNLWTLGEQYCAETDDLREWIKAVKECNGLKSDKIVSGYNLIVLVKKS